MKRDLLIGVVFIALALIIFSSCNKSEVNEEYGTLKIKITDDPFPVEFIEEAIITITKVEVRLKDNDEEDPFIILSEDTLELNLLNLRNGVMGRLTKSEVPVGEYDLIRLYIDRAGITVRGHDSYELKVPSGSQTGIKIFIKPAIEVKGELTSELLLDFNLDRSFVLKGNMNTPGGIIGFDFKPVIRAVNNSTAGTVHGVVRDTANAVLANAEVWIEADTLIGTAYTDSTGYYGLPGIPEGFYTLYSTRENYDTVIYNDLKVNAGYFIIKDFVLTPEN